MMKTKLYQSEFNPQYRIDLTAGVDADGRFLLYVAGEPLPIRITKEHPVNVRIDGLPAGGAGMTIDMD